MKRNRSDQPLVGDIVRILVMIYRGDKYAGLTYQPAKVTAIKGKKLSVMTYGVKGDYETSDWLTWDQYNKLVRPETNNETIVPIESAVIRSVSRFAEIRITVPKVRYPIHSTSEDRDY